MAHRLEPNKGCAHLPPVEIVSRLKATFPHVDVSLEDGAKWVQQMVDQFVRMEAPQHLIYEHIKLKPLAAQVIVTGEPVTEDEYLRFLVMPDYSPLIGYHSQKHEDKSRWLLEKCAACLDYKIVLV
jgi:hypothetical protein